MLELLSGLSAVAGLIALISPKTPIAKKVFNKIGIENEFLEKHNTTYNKILLFITMSIFLIVILSIIAYLDYSKFVFVIFYIIMFSGLFTILSTYSRIADKIQKKTDIRNRRFLSSYGNKPVILLSATLFVSFILLSTAPTIYQSKEISYLYENLKNNEVQLHTLISNKEIDKNLFANKYENIVKLTQKAQLLQDYERYYKEGIEFTCDSILGTTNHSIVKRDLFQFLCNNFDNDFREIYLPQFENSFFMKRTGVPPESYPLNWLIKATEKQSYKLSRLILNIRLLIGNGFLLVKNKLKSIVNIVIGVLVITLCYFGAIKIYRYNQKYDKDAAGPKFIFYALFSLISFITFLWSMSI